MTKRRKKRAKKDEVTNIGISYQTQDTITRYGQAASQYIDGYLGLNDISGKPIKKGLRHVAKYQITEDRNRYQQAGKSAEIYYESKTNAENIIKRIDDRVAFTDNIGMHNDQHFDHVKVDANGKPIRGRDGDLIGSQMKFRSSAETNVRKLVRDKEWDKYRKADILVPADQVQSSKDFANRQARELRQQAKVLREKGQLDLAKAKEEQAKRYSDISKRIKDSGISSDKAMELRTNPLKVTVQDTLQTAHRAGMDQALAGAKLSGALSVGTNLIAVAKGDKEIGKAVVDSAVDTAKGAAMSYVVSAGGSLVKAGLTESSKRVAHTGLKSVLSALAEGNGPALIVSTTIEVGKSLKRYYDGEISASELVIELGQKGTGIVASTYAAELGAVVGTIIFPGAGTVIGGIVGGMVGYMVSCQLYQAAVQFLSELGENSARNQRIIEIAERSLEMLEQQQQQLDVLIDQHFSNRRQVLRECFINIRNAMMDGDSDGIARQLHNIAETFGREIQFKTFSEFDIFMRDPDTRLKLL